MSFGGNPKATVNIAQHGFDIQLSEDKGRQGFLILRTELGGRGISRQEWRLFVPNIDAIVFVVDSTHDWTKDAAKKTSHVNVFGFNYLLPIHARDELKRLLKEELLRGLPLLLVAENQEW